MFDVGLEAVIANDLFCFLLLQRLPFTQEAGAQFIERITSSQVKVQVLNSFVYHNRVLRRIEATTSLNGWVLLLCRP
jgi:hypothetical protein